MKASIKIVTAQKNFSQSDLDTFRRILNVLREHDLSVRLTIKKKVTTDYRIGKTKLKAI